MTAGFVDATATVVTAGSARVTEGVVSVAAADSEALVLPNSLSATAADIRVTSRINDNPYAVRLAKGLSEGAQKDVDKLARMI